MKRHRLSLETVVLTRGMTALRLMPVTDKPFFSSDEESMVVDIIGALLNMGIKIHANTKYQIVFESPDDLKKMNDMENASCK